MLLRVQYFRYEERLGKLCSFSLEQRRVRGNQIEAWKIMSDIDKGV